MNETDYILMLIILAYFLITEHLICKIERLQNENYKLKKEIKINGSKSN